MEKAFGENLYFSLDEAREELKKRWNDAELKKKVEDELGENFWPEFKDKPRAFLGRCLLSPDNGLNFLLSCANYVKAAPLNFEYLGDKYVTINEEKKGLGRLRLINDKREKILADIIDFKSNESRKINEVVTRTGESLIDFHHSLLQFAKYDIDVVDRTEWFRKIGTPDSYYYYYLSHFIAHGVLFETFLMDGDEREMSFTDNIVAPMWEAVEKKFGLKPMVVHLYPENQDDLEDFYWWSYPPNINDHLISYVKENNIPFKIIK